VIDDVVTPSDREHPDLENLLDEAGQFCQPRDAGWESLQERLPNRQELEPGPRRGYEEMGPAPGPCLEKAEKNGLTRVPVPVSSQLRRVPRWGWWAAAVVAASLLAAAIVWQAWRPRGEAPSPPVTKSEPDSLDQPVALALGCRVTPVGDVSFQIVEPRRVQLDCGELYVEIDREKSGDEPFVVETLAGEAKAVGTSFVVETGPVESKPRPDSAPSKTSQSKRDLPMATPFPNITFLTKVLVLAGVVQLATAEGTVEARSGEVIAAKSDQTIRAAVSSSPIYWALRKPEVRRELGLTQQQRRRIVRIGTEFVKASRGAWVGVKDLEPEQRRKKYQEIRVQTQLRMEEARKKIKDVLTAEQYDKLLMAQLRVRGLRVLQSEPCVQRLSVTEDQRKKLTRKTAELSKKISELQQQMQKVRDEAFDDAIEVLTPEQIEKLKRMEASGPRAWGAVGLPTLSAQGRPAAAVRRPMKVPAVELKKNPFRAPLKAQPVQRRPVKKVQRVPTRHVDKIQQVTPRRVDKVQPR